ncbi:uncharacterized protein ISCGN_005783, partial [Ixodes scapularis]
MPPKTSSAPNRDEDDSSESGTQEPTDAAGAGEGSSTRASPDAGILPPAPAGGAADVGEFMRAMTAMMETFSRQIVTTPGVASATPMSLPRPRLSVPTPTYAGYSDGKSVHDFLQDLDAYVAALGASEETALVQIVPIALTGDASRWRRLQRPFLSMADFRTRFREEFLPPDYEMRIRDELANRTQHPDESLLEYVRAFQELYSRAEPSASDAEKVARAIQRCHPRFTAYLRGRDFADLEALAREARTVQAGLLAELQYRPPPRAEESLEPRCAWAGRAADTHIESRTAYTAVAERGHGVTITPRALDPFAYEKRRRAANANSARVQTRGGGAVVNHRRGATGHDSRGNHDSPRFATDEVS